MRNASSFLGVFWYLLGPLLTFIILLIVFSGRLGSHVEHYPLYLLSGIVMWNFFSAGTSHALSCLMSQAGLIKSLPVRREFLVLSTVFDVLVSHFFEIAIFLLIAWFYGVLTPTVLVFPFIVLLNIFFTFGVGLGLSALFFVFRDLGHVWSIVIKIWWFATPIFYALFEGGKGEKVSVFNPMYHIIHSAREVLIYGQLPEASSLLIASGFAVAALIVGFTIFSFLNPRLAEYV